jgi:hypothetical protein
MLFGPNPQLDGQQNSTLHKPICIVEKSNSLCIFGRFGYFRVQAQGNALECFPANHREMWAGKIRPAVAGLVRIAKGNITRLPVEESFLGSRSAVLSEVWC